MSFPTLLVTSVIRGSEQGESHGGIYLVDMNTGAANCKLEWDTCNIDFNGRGADRGLRGIAYNDDAILIAASDEVFIFDQNFTICGSIKSPYLKHCHEICIWDGRLYLTSTGFDSILVYNLADQLFETAYYIASHDGSFKPQMYDPNKPGGPKPSNKLHINSVAHTKGGLFFSGRKAPFLFRLQGSKFSSAGSIPKGTHNAQRSNGWLIYNDTIGDIVCCQKGSVSHTFNVPTHATETVIGADKYTNDIARVGFGRGMCRVSDTLIAAGSSPSTIALHSLETGETVKTVNISKDIRNAVHGLEVWPY